MDIKDLNVDQFTNTIAEKVVTKVQEKLDQHIQLTQQQQQQRQNSPNQPGR